VEGLEIDVIGCKGLREYAEGRLHLRPTLTKYLVEILRFTTGLPSEEFIGCTLQGATGPDTLNERPRLCRYSVWEPEGIP
jgi:hypothetical protein